MKYYNQSKTERNIRRQARLTTFAIIALISGAVFFMSSESTKDLIPDQVKEWFNQDDSKEETKPKQKRIELKHHFRSPGASLSGARQSIHFKLIIH